MTADARRPPGAEARRCPRMPAGPPGADARRPPGADARRPPGAKCPPTYDVADHTEILLHFPILSCFFTHCAQVRYLKTKHGFAFNGVLTPRTTRVVTDETPVDADCKIVERAQEARCICMLQLGDLAPESRN